MNLALFGSIITWNYLLFVQFWPTTWIQNQHITNANFSNDHFNIHGIWPQYYNGSYPQFCDNSTVFDVDKLSQIIDNLTIYWTDYQNATNFWQHEFSKHGTCAATDPILQPLEIFFATGLALRSKYDIYDYLARNGVLPSNHVTYETKSIQDLLHQQIGKRISITCENGKLDEIIICLDKNLNPIDCPDNITYCPDTNIVYGKLGKN